MSEGIRKGTKISADEAKSLDRSKMGVAITGTAEVEGQDPYIGRVECPWCFTRGRAILDTDYYKWFECGGCGRPFRA
jgi:hypothetical protein